MPGITLRTGDKKRTRRVHKPFAATRKKKKKEHPRGKAKDQLPEKEEKKGGNAPTKAHGDGPKEPRDK